jgi:hypothetical protein
VEDREEHELFELAEAHGYCAFLVSGFWGWGGD